MDWRTLPPPVPLRGNFLPAELAVKIPICGGHFAYHLWTATDAGSPNTPSPRLNFSKALHFAALVRIFSLKNFRHLPASFGLKIRTFIDAASVTILDRSGAGAEVWSCHQPTPSVRSRSRPLSGLCYPSASPRCGERLSCLNISEVRAQSGGRDNVVAREG